MSRETGFCPSGILLRSWDFVEGSSRILSRDRDFVRIQFCQSRILSRGLRICQKEEQNFDRQLGFYWGSRILSE